MLEKLEKKKKTYGIYGDIYIRENGDFVACSLGKQCSLNNYKYGNINNLSNDEIFELVVTLLEESLKRDKFETVDKCGKDADKIYLWEIEDYKKDKCESVKRLTVEISDLFPKMFNIVECECLGKHYWGGGRYMHLLPIKSDKDDIVSKIKEIYNYKEGHLPGTTEEEQKKYRVIKR